jgi:CPA1 family monovalent cation:H+ antiporter
VNLAVILIRIVWVFPAAYLGRLVSHAPSGPEGNTGWREVTILAWTGMRGVVSLAAALALPLSLQGGQPFVWRDLILFLTFSVIFGTLVLQGLTLPFLIKSLSIKEDDSSIREEREARIKANEAALARLKQLDARIHPDHEAVVLLQTEYEDRLRQVKRAGQDSGKSNLFSEDYQRLAYETLQVERDILLELRNSGVIGDDVLRRIQRDIDFAEARLRFPDFGTIDENASSNPGDQPPPQKQTGNPL